MRLKDTLILLEKREIALVSALSHCRLPYTLRDFARKSGVELVHFRVK